MTARRSALLFVALLGGCTGTTPANEILAPDPDGIMVFFPTVDGTVYGRGLPGTFKDPRVQYARVEAQPTGTFESKIRVEADGSFEFHLIAVSNDTLEIRGHLDEAGTVVGDSTYIKVPVETFSRSDRVCCLEPNAAEGFCEDVFAREERLMRGDPCPSGIDGISTACISDNECGVDEGEFILIDPMRMLITAPNEMGEIEVAGVVPPNALVTVENRELNGIGVPSRIRRHFKISSACTTDYAGCVPGTFKFTGIKARGDDELVIQAMLLNSTRSAPTSFKVPDSEMVGVDVLGAEAWEDASPLINGRRGPIALYLSPYGRDGRGICPDLPSADRHPESCWTGGLTHSMVNFALEVEDVTKIDTCDARPIPTTPNAQIPFNRGWDGDVRTPAQDIVVVIDMTAKAKEADVGASPQRFGKIAAFIRDLRVRDRVGVVLFGGAIDAGYGGLVVWKAVDSDAKIPKPGIRWLGVEDPNAVGRTNAMVSGAERAQLVTEVEGLTDVAADETADIYDGIRSGIDMLTQARSGSGRIIVIGSSTPDGPDAALNEHLKEYSIPHRDQVDRLTGSNEITGNRGITVDFVDINDMDVANTDVINTVEFSGQDGGTVLETSVGNLNLKLLELRRKIAGSFILLYDMSIPESAGKSGTLTFRVRVTVPYFDPIAGRREITAVSPPMGQPPHSFAIKINGSDGGCMAGTPGCESCAGD